MIDSTRSGAVVDERSTWLAELVVEADAGSETEKALQDTLSEPWTDGRRSTLAATITGVSPEQQTEAGLAAGLFGKQRPEQIGMLAAGPARARPATPGRRA